MRNLTSDTRVFTEPFTLALKTQETTNGMTQTVEGKRIKMFGNVMIEKSNSKTQIDSLHNGDSIKITLRSRGVDIIPELATVTVRGKEYTVKSVDHYGINTEYMSLTAQRIE